MAHSMCAFELCLHNIYDASGRATACREITRVLKPGSVAIISRL